MPLRHATSRRRHAPTYLEKRSSRGWYAGAAAVCSPSTAQLGVIACSSPGAPATATAVTGAPMPSLLLRRLGRCTAGVGTAGADGGRRARVVGRRSGVTTARATLGGLGARRTTCCGLCVAGGAWRWGLAAAGRARCGGRRRRANDGAQSWRHTTNQHATRMPSESHALSVHVARQVAYAFEVAR